MLAIIANVYETDGDGIIYQSTYTAVTSYIS
jgi:hypothetical protein